MGSSGLRFVLAFRASRYGAIIKMRQIHQIFFNAITSYGATLCRSIIAFSLVPYVVTRIGAESYGVLLLAISAMGMVVLLGMGLSKAVTKNVSGAVAKSEVGLVNIIYSNSLVWFIAIGLIGALSAVLIGQHFSDLFPEVSPALAREGRLAMFIIAGAILVCLVGDAWKGLLAGVQRYDIINAAGCLQSGVRAICIVVYFNLANPTLLSAVVIFSLSYVLERICFAAACYKVIPELRASSALVSRLGMRMIAGFATFVVIGTVANLLISHLVKFLIGRSFGLTELTNYGIALTLMVFANAMVRSFANVLMPVASKYHAVGDGGTVGKLFIHGTKYSAVVILSCAGITAPFLPALYRLWMGPDFVALCGITLVMFFGQAVASSALCANQILTGMGKVKSICVISLCYVAFSLVAVWLHIILWQDANLFSTVVIVAIGRIIGNIVILGLGIEMTGIDWRRLLAQAVVKPLVICSIVAVLGWWIVRWMPIESWVILGSWVLAMEVIFLILIGVWCLDREERKLAMQLLGRVRMRLNLRK